MSINSKNGFLKDSNGDYIMPVTNAENVLTQNGESTAEVDLITNKKQIDNISLKGFLKYGVIDLDKFIGLNHNIGFNLWRDPSDDKIKHDWVLEDSDYSIRYISESGASINDGLTRATAWSNFLDAVSQCENDVSLSKIKFIFIDVNHRETTRFSGNVSKKYIITSETPMPSSQYISSYSAYSGDVVKGICGYVVNGVVYTDKTDVRGLPLSLRKVVSTTECINTPMSFYSDGVDVYINNPNTTTLNTLVLISDTLFQFTLTSSDAEVVLDGLTLLTGSNSNSCYFTTDVGTKGNVIINNVDILNMGHGDSYNGVGTDGIEDIKLFNVRVFNSVRDGFNYHNTKTTDGKGNVFEYNCYAENVGLDTLTYNNNISTAHEGINIVRIGTKGRKSRGSLIADVNGCYSVNIDCSVYDTSITSLSDQNSAYYFDDSPALYAPNPNGKAWLINCCGGSLTEYAINGDLSFKQIDKIYVNNFNGNMFPNDIVLSEFNQ